MNLFFYLMFLFLIPTIQLTDSGSIYYTFFKGLTSLCFLCCALINSKKIKEQNKYPSLILAALFFGLLGDIALTLPLKLSFIFGALFFAIGHLIYIKSFMSLAGFNKAGKLISLLIFISITCFISFSGIFKFDGILPVAIIYTLIISIMLISSFNLLSIYERNKSFVLATIGGSSLFFISDFILLFIEFYSGSPSILSVFNLTSYYTGQILISFSLSKFINFSKNSSYAM